MTKMAGVPQTKPGFAKHTVFATLNFRFLLTFPSFLETPSDFSNLVAGRSWETRDILLRTETNGAPRLGACGARQSSDEETLGGHGAVASFAA